MNASSSAADLAELLGRAYQDKTTVRLPAALEPADLQAAFALQQRLLQRCGLATGGWKIGAKSPDGPIQGAPLPQTRIYSSAAAIARRDYPVLGLELEVYFVLDRDFGPQDRPVPEREVLASIASFGAAIEIVSSRISGWPDAPKLSQLADLQNNGALIVGSSVDYRSYRSDFPFAAPRLAFSLAGVPLTAGPARNPAGDPRRLLSWLVNQCRASGLSLPAGSIIPTGSYTGLELPAQAGTVCGEIAGLPAVCCELV